MHIQFGNFFFSQQQFWSVGYMFWQAKLFFLLYLQWVNILFYNSIGWFRILHTKLPHYINEWVCGRMRANEKCLRCAFSPVSFDDKNRFHVKVLFAYLRWGRGGGEFIMNRIVFETFVLESESISTESYNFQQMCIFCWTTKLFHLIWHTCVTIISYIIPLQKLSMLSTQTHTHTHIKYKIRIRNFFSLFNAIQIYL